MSKENKKEAVKIADQIIKEAERQGVDKKKLEAMKTACEFIKFMCVLDSEDVESAIDEYFKDYWSRKFYEPEIGGKISDYKDEIKLSGEGFVIDLGHLKN